VPHAMAVAVQLVLHIQFDARATQWQAAAGGGVAARARCARALGTTIHPNTYGEHTRRQEPTPSGHCALSEAVPPGPDRVTRHGADSGNAGKTTVHVKNVFPQRLSQSVKKKHGDNGDTAKHVYCSIMTTG